jgi:hypothetical protein
MAGPVVNVDDRMVVLVVECGKKWEAKGNRVTYGT